ncbi:hypothetical protein AMJ52_07715 [candidate division TA06 bacterium DG_78]|uniref:Porin n=1 Tax=candidate division TA06 bacterium DG_78 TaxID=1703772 RepID=A0A0S7YB70_UNCT6|nr:MAG: hypothetical protein AMJ52_07715 [candidate division TA06 bacterium DG_78]
MNILLIFITLWDYSYNVDCDFIYDDNIFAYSQEYLDDFINQVRPYRFPFETHDDLISSIDLGLLLRNKFFGNRTTTFNFDIRVNHYLVNNQKNYQILRIGIRQSFGRYAVKLSYYIIPNYLIRYYQNPQEENSNYIGCEVQYQNVQGKFSYMPNPLLSISIVYNRKWDDYREEFSLYDANSHIVGFDSDIKVKKNLGLQFGYELKTSRIDSLSAIETTSEPIPDGAYNQHTVDAGIMWGFRFLKPTEVKLLYRYYFRNYSTDFASDSMHYGRHDHNHRILISTGFKIFPGMKIEVSYLKQWRIATSDIFPDIDEIKNYNKYRISCGLHFYH